MFAGRTGKPDRNWVRVIRVALLLGGVFVLAHQLGTGLKFPPDEISPIWPPNAVILTAMLMLRPKWWALLLPLSMGLEALLNQRFGFPTALSVWFAVANLSETILAAVLLRRWLGPAPDIQRLKTLTLFLAVAAGAAPALSACIAAGAASWGGQPDAYWRVWRQWFMGDSLTHVLVTPALIIWSRQTIIATLRMRPLRVLETSALALTVLGAGVWVFGQAAPQEQDPHLFYSPLPLLMWAALRFGPRGLTAAVMGFGLTSIWTAVHGQGLFHLASPALSVLNLQLYLLGVGVPTLYLSVVIAERNAAAGAIEEREQRYHALFQSMVSGLIVHDVVYGPDGYPVDFRFVDLNPACEELTGLRRDRVLGRRLLEVLPGLEREWVDFFARVATTGASGHILQYARELERYYEAVAYRPRPGQLAVSFTDVTQRVMAEEALRESSARLQAIMDNSGAMIYLVDRDDRFVMVNRRFSQTFGHSVERIVGLTARDLMPAEMAGTFAHANRQVLQSGQTVQMQSEATLADGPHTFLTVKVPLLDGDGRPSLVCGISMDISEQKHVERQLIEHQERLRDLATELARTEDRLRRRLAETLHDGIGQNLFAVMARLAALPRMAPEATADVEQTRALLQETLRDLRELTIDLCPPVLYEVGLEAALMRLLNQTQQATGINCRLESGTERLPIDPEVRGMLYQGVRELLSNAARHAHARNVTVGVHGEDGTLAIRVEDDGCGFQGDQPADAGSGFGLFNLRQRLGALGGRLEVRTGDRRGSMVSMLLPLPKAYAATGATK